MEKQLVCVAGKNNIAVDVLEYLVQHCDDRFALCVICNKTETGINTWQKSLRYFAKRHGIRECCLEEIYGHPNLIFLSLEFDRIVKPELFCHARLYNIHFSLLPQYKGMYTAAMPILNGEKIVGVTLHKIDRGIDTGDVIAQKSFELGEKTTSRDLYFLYIHYGTRLVLEHMEDMLSGNVDAVAQCSGNSSYYSRHSIDYSNLQIDLNQTAEGIDRQLRAYSFREYQLPYVRGKSIIAGSITGIQSSEKPGTMLFEGAEGMMMATVDYNICLYYDRLYELMSACADGNMDVVANICSVTEHINAAGKNGCTPLMMAVDRNHLDIVHYLLCMGADIRVRDCNGMTLLMYAQKTYLRTGDDTIFRLLQRMGLEEWEYDYDGHDLEYYWKQASFMESTKRYGRRKKDDVVQIKTIQGGGRKDSLIIELYFAAAQPFMKQKERQVA